MGAMRKFNILQRRYEWSQARAYYRKLDQMDIAEAEYKAMQEEADEERELDEVEDVEED